VVSSEFWDILAAHHSSIENNYLDRASVQHIMEDLREPVLVVGAGQGLIVEEVLKKGLQCGGVDFSPEMIRQAKVRRGLALVQADARALPFGDGTYGTILYATGVVDFAGDEKAIQSMLEEGRRVLKPSGRMFIAFYRLSDALERFLARLGLLNDNVLSHRECLETYLLTPAQMLRWVAKRAGTGYVGAVVLLFRLSVLGTLREKTTTFKMQKIFRQMANPNMLIQAAPEKQPYRNEAEIGRLLDRLAIPVKEIRRLPACWIAQGRPDIQSKN
jgi:ubiquinone/menaquinone biosynthesis C-methylase UbiE